MYIYIICISDESYVYVYMYIYIYMCVCVYMLGIHTSSPLIPRLSRLTLARRREGPPVPAEDTGLLGRSAPSNAWLDPGAALVFVWGAVCRLPYHQASS